MFRFKVSLKMLTLYIPTLAKTVSKMNHLVRCVTHHNKQNESVPCPIPSPTLPLVLLVQPTWGLSSVLEI